MSALQTFLLVVDHNKQEANQIANQVAQGESFGPLLWLVLTTCLRC